jgi:mono/diheme cytochrome c family protein
MRCGSHAINSGSATIPLSKMEVILAGHAVDASVARAAPNTVNPVTPNEPNLAAGARLYRDHCAMCREYPENSKSQFADYSNLPAPQFTTDTADLPENQNFCMLEHGIRWTVMAGWKNVLGDRQTWKTVTSLNHMDDLPTAAKQVFVAPASRTSLSSNAR